MMTAGMRATSRREGEDAHVPATLAAVLRAAHGGPALAVTTLSVLLGLGIGLTPGRVLLVGAAVLTSQLSIGWSNDLLDLARDREVGRSDKPLVAGQVRPGLLRAACVAALAVTIPLALACGVAAALVHLVNTAAGWAYNLGLKATAWSWLPYAVAFGGLPVFVSLASPSPSWPAAWQLLAGAMLGVGAHFLNVLPDLADDEATGVRGLPHRLGERSSRRCAIGLLALATVVILLGTGSGALGGILSLGAVVVLVPFALRGTGRVPFLAAIGIALVDVALLVAAG